MPTNYIFSGFGHAAGRHSVTNDDLYAAARQGALRGFNEQLIRQSPNYQAYQATHPQATPFDYFVGHKMGFERRSHVAPWPPTRERQGHARTALDLLAEAVAMALDDAGVDAEEIGSWIVSTVSPHEQAPGIAATLKAYFATPHNQTTAMTLTSGCAGFNKGIRRALDHFKAAPTVRHILLAHTETMSRFLTHDDYFVNHSTFGDAAAACVISVSESAGAEGIVAHANHHDPLMIDAVGVDAHGDLYMDGGWVKRRAVKNIEAVSGEVLRAAGWSIGDIDMLVPHQTGNVILHEVAAGLGLPPEKLYQGVQRNYGNVSGASIPLSLSLLSREGRLRPGAKVLCPTAGVGGEYGAFAYVVPQAKAAGKAPRRKAMEGQSALILFADSPLGQSLAQTLESEGCRVAAHRSTDFDPLDNAAMDAWLDTQAAGHDHLVNLFGAHRLCAALDSFQAASRWGEANQRLTRRLFPHTRQTLLAAENGLDAADHPSAPYAAALFAGWKGLAGSMAGEAASKGLRTIWYLPGIHTQVPHGIDDESSACAAQRRGLPQALPTERLAGKIARSLYLLKVAETRDRRLGPMLEREEISRHGE